MHAVLWAVYLFEGMVHDLCGTEIWWNFRTFEKANCGEQLLCMHLFHAEIPLGRLRPTGRHC